MLVSLNKNTWLWKWVYETVDPDNSIYEYLLSAYAKTRPSEIRNKMLERLIDKGYTVKITSGEDVIIAMSEEEFTFLKLKYQ
jgi:hypothetical protein